jgi:adenine-specific DNA-methyltransferase
MDLGHPFLKEQLIAYIGNKRALLPFLHDVFSRLPVDPTQARFLDPFAGSGSVARLARLMGFAVQANDWEPYARVINSCHLCVGASEIGSLFRGRGGLPAVLAELNGLAPLPEERAYISRHYAPHDTERADWRTERLFYTRENALVIDAVRERIEEMYPGSPADPASFREKAVLLAPLLYEAATHTNTSGVFKACHRGFGGHGKDALHRIMAGILIREPVLVDTAAPCGVECGDARAFLSKRSAEVCYLDPPYAVHQYGSNYFMLNTIALWDRPPVSDERTPDGRLRHKAGIRPDWTRTRSAFCYKATALSAMREVVHAADCRWLVVSYSNEGLIGLEELCDLLAETGSLSMRSTGYVKYPGGKQSLSRTIRNLECALIVERGRGGAGRAEVRSPANAAREIVRETRIAQLLGCSFVPDRVREGFTVEGEGIVVGPCGGRMVRLPLRHFWRFVSPTPPPRFDSVSDAEAFIARLSGCAVRDVREEIGVLVAIVAGYREDRGREALCREILRLVNKLAHLKYRAEFQQTLQSLRDRAGEGIFDASFLSSMEAIEARARRRLALPSKTGLKGENSHFIP